MALHKDLIGADLHVTKLHADTHVAAGTDPLNLGESQVTALVADLAAKKTDNVSATDKILGRVTAGAGVIEEIACTAAGRELLNDANAAAQRATLGILATPSFSANKIDADQTGVSNASGTNTKMTATTEVFDNGGYYDAPNSKFTPLVPGVYLFGATIYFTVMSDQVSYGILLYKNGSKLSYISIDKTSGTSGLGSSATGITNMNGTTDYVELYVFQESTAEQTLVKGLCGWWGCRVG